MSFGGAIAESAISSLLSGGGKDGDGGGVLSKENLEKFEKLAGGMSGDMSAEEAKKHFESMPAVHYDPKDDTAYILGVVPVPATMVSTLAPFYTMLLQPLMESGQEKLYKATSGRFKYAKELSVALPMAVTAGHDMVKLVGTARGYMQDKETLREHAAPVLDVLKGRHDKGALASITEGDNEVIYAARRRIAKNVKLGLMSDVIESAEHAPVLYSLYAGREGVWNKVDGGAAAQQMSNIGYKEKLEVRKEVVADLGSSASAEEIRDYTAQKIKEKYGIADVADAAKGDSKFTGVKKAGTTAGVSGVVRMVSNMYQKQATKNQPPVSTFDMIFELRKQFDEDPDRTKFKLPDGMKGERSLEQYIVECFRNVQLEMRPDAPIGKRLEEPLLKVAKPMADAIRDGEMGVMGLVDLVGGRQVLKQQGRRVDLMHVEENIARTAKMFPAMQYGDADKQLDQAPYTEAEAKEAFAKLPADERMVLGLMVPPAIRAKLGDSVENIRADYQQFEAHKGDVLSKCEAFLKEAATRDTDALANLGWLKDEITAIQKLGKAAEKGDHKAIEKAIKSPANSPLVAGLAIQEIQAHGRIVPAMSAKPVVAESANDASEVVAHNDNAATVASKVNDVKTASKAESKSHVAREADRAEMQEAASHGVGL